MVPSKEGSFIKVRLSYYKSDVFVGFIIWIIRIFPCAMVVILRLPFGNALPASGEFFRTYIVVAIICGAGIGHVGGL
jgi:hypothetical protein